MTAQRILTVPAEPARREMHFTFPCPRCPNGTVKVGTGPYLQPGEDELLVAMVGHAHRVHGEPGPFTADTHDEDGQPVEVILLV